MTHIATAIWLPAALLFVFGASAVLSLVGEGPTFDETAHLPAGYSYLATFDYRLTPEHPPLAKVLSAIPLVAVGAQMPHGDALDGWRRGDASSFGYDFLYRTTGNDADTLLILGRLPIVVLGVLLGALIYSFAKELMGETGGRMALFCFAFCPTMLAHARLATTDVALALFYMATVHALYRLGRSLSLSTCGYLGLTLGCALATKFSALLLIPVAIVLLSWRAVDTTALAVRLGSWERSLEAPLRKGGALAIALGVSFAVALVVVWATYGFRFAAHSGLAIHLETDVTTTVSAYLRQQPWLGQVVGVVRANQLLPQSYIDGFAYLAARSFGRGSYLLGQHSTAGFPLFFPIAFLVKTPLPIILLLLPAILALLRGGSCWSWPRRCVGVATLIYLLVSLAVPLNIGQRHLLPLYPFIFLVIASLAPWLDGARRGRSVLLKILALWYVGSWAYVSPHYLAYFNELAMGPAHGSEFLVDSNLDWGQDTKALGRWVRLHGIAPIPYAHFGTSRPQYYGIEPFISLPGASFVPASERAAEWTLDEVKAGRAEFIAIHLTNLRGLYLPDTVTINGRTHSVGRNYYRELWDLNPVARIGYSINVYRNPWYRTPTPKGLLKNPS